MTVDELRKAISDSVHRAICQSTKSDGFRHCMLYAVAGCEVASRVFRKRYVLQAGSFYVIADPPRGALFSSDLWSGKTPGFETVDFHCWFAYSKSRHVGPVPAAELVDLTARHYKTLVNCGGCVEHPNPKSGTMDATG